LLELLVDAGVIAAKRAYTDDDYVDDAGRIQRAFSVRPVAADWIVLTKARARDIRVSLVPFVTNESS
jgi:hypothetical protein